jgi:hypothetical protein
MLRILLCEVGPDENDDNIPGLDPTFEVGPAGCTWNESDGPLSRKWHGALVLM